MSQLKRKQTGNSKIPVIKLRRIGSNQYEISPSNDQNYKKSKKKNQLTEPPQTKSCFNGKLYSKTWRLRGYVDILKVMNDYEDGIERSITHHLKNNQPLKFYITLKSHLYKMDAKSDAIVNEIVYFHSRTRRILRESEFDEIYSDIKNHIWSKFDQWLKNGSGYRINNVENISLFIAKYNPISGTTYIKTPSHILGKHAVINVKNNDSLCFIWSILAALKHNQLKHSYGKVSSYRKYVKFLKFDESSLPMKIENIPKFERENNLSINVYSTNMNGDEINPLFLSKVQDCQLINLLLIMGKEKNHYVWVKNFNRLLCNNKITLKDTKVFCPSCMYGFVKRYNGEQRLAEHLEYCSELSPQRVILPKKGEEIIKFKDFEKSLKLPFIIYADFECVIKPMSTTTEGIKSNHEVSGYAFNVISPYYQTKMYLYRGKDAGIRFLKEISKVERRIINVLQNESKEMKALTPEQKREYSSSHICHICQMKIDTNDPKNMKVRDHCHFTGNFRGAAHNSCNLMYRTVKRIPVFFHNLSRYDAHIIFQSLIKMKGVKAPNVVAKGLENFIAFSIGKLYFKDSLQFLNASLDKLVKNLHLKANKENNLNGIFKHTFSYFKRRWCHIPQEAFLMLLRKGVYPYTYMNSFDRFKETKLPPKSDYYNDLTQKDISQDEYDFAHTVFKTFKLENLGALHDLYVATDVNLLSDVFENFRNTSMKNYELDPAHFFTSPGLSWAAALKYTKVELELPTDPNIPMFVDKGIIGGISLIGNQIAEANNERIGEKFDSKLEKTFILLLDANNLYGYAMSEYLPYGGFRWVEEMNYDSESMTKLTQRILELKDDSDFGYIFQVDLQYPKELHDLHDTYPLAPEHMTINKDMLSDYQRKLATDLGINIGGNKLCLTLYNKTKYICHYRNLKQYLQLGLKLTKCHKILEFKQSCWLKSYIDLNTSLRQKALSKFDEDQAKLFNNSFFGKTCEDTRRYKTIKIVNDAKKAQKLINKPIFNRVKIYEENLTAFQMRKQTVKLDKPRYIGMVVLELSKLLMYDFHYNYFLKKYPRSKLLFTDTDSLCYWIPSSTDIYNDLKKSERMDFSNYDKSHPNFDDKFHLTPGKFKDETGGIPIVEFVGLRAKMYSILKDDGKGKMTCKGISESVKKRFLNHKLYKEALLENKVRYDQIIRIMQSDHQLFTVNTRKNSLSPFNDKKYITKENSTLISHSFGHYSLNDKKIAL